MKSSNIEQAYAIFLQKISGLNSTDILSSCIAQPLEEKAILIVEKKFGKALPLAIKSFYRLCNGIQLILNNTLDKPLVDNPSLQIASPFPLMWPTEHYWHLNNVMNIPDLETFLFKDYKDFMWFDFEKNYQITLGNKQVNLQDFKKQLRPFDLFDKNYTIAFHFSGDTDYILLGDDHNATFEDFKPISFEKYIIETLTTLGDVKSRLALFKPIDEQ